jgi:hypothetical protein
MPVSTLTVRPQTHTDTSIREISSYGGRGVAKRGFTPHDQHLHAIIHMRDVDPTPIAGESGIDLRPIAVESYNGRILDPMSRINFAITYVVDSDVKVRRLGKVPQSSLRDLHANHAAIRAELGRRSTTTRSTSTV